MSQLRLKIPHAPTKPQHRQINKAKYYQKKKKKKINLSESLFCQFFPERASSLISALNSFQDVMKVSNYSGCDLFFERLIASDNFYLAVL